MPTYSYAGTGGVRPGGAASVPLTSFVVLVNSDVTTSIAGSDVKVSWSTPFPSGSWYQVYINGSYAVATPATTVMLPAVAERIRVVVAAVPASMADTDFSDRLHPVYQQRALLTWFGGRYLGEHIAGYNIYVGSIPGGAVSFKSPVASFASSIGQDNDGYGCGGYGAGGYGSAASQYTWESATLTNGRWNFAVTSVDDAGNESAPTLASCTIDGPPEPPAPFPDGTRLHCVYVAMTGVANLIWNPSPSA